MLPASNRGAGMSLGFPDVCLTPAGPAVVPVPYPNIAMNAQAVGFSPFVKISGVNALNVTSRIPMTSGDEAGSAHPSIKGGASYTMGNPIVNIDKAPAINLTSTGMANNGNCPMNAAIVPSAVTVMFCRAGGGSEGTTVPGERRLGDPRPATAAIEMLGDEMTQRSITSARMLGGGVLFVRLARVAPGAPAEMFAHVQARTGAARALVVDLTGNPGGALDVAIQLARFFLPPGAVIAHLVEDGDDTTVVAHEAGACALPLVVLIDGGTASAAELLAASLQDNQRAVVVGSRSHGKRAVHRVASTPGGPTTLLAEQTWDRPSRGPRRIAPDVPSAPEGALEQAWALALALADETG